MCMRKKQLEGAKQQERAVETCCPAADVGPGDNANTSSILHTQTLTPGKAVQLDGRKKNSFCFCFFEGRIPYSSSNLHSSSNLQQNSKRHTTLQHTATHCNTRKHTAAHCNTLHHIAALCNIFECVPSLGHESNSQLLIQTL